MFEVRAVVSGLQTELARLRADGRGRSVAELVDVVGACQSVINQATALQTLAMAHVAAIEDVDLEDGTVAEQHRGLGHQRLDAPDLVSEQLGMTTAAASSRVATGVDVVTRLGGVFDAMGQGRLDGYRAGVVSDELRDADPEVCAAVVATIDESLGSEPAAALRRRVRRALGAVDADLVRAKAARARSERSLRRWPGDEPGVDTWMGSFPAEQARSGWAVVDGLARQYVRDGLVTGLEQARADALMDLIHARATGTFVVQLAVPADQLPDLTQRDPTPRDLTRRDTTRRDTTGSADSDLAGADPAGADPAGAEASSASHLDAPTRAVAADPAGDELLTVAGLGMPGTTQVRRGWVQALSAATRPAGRREVVSCHGATGALLAVTSSLDRADRPGRPLATESQRYRPPAALIDLVKARDGRCRFPGCTVNARFCDVDHVRPWPLGQTHAANLICLCRRHHRIKQTTRWRVRVEPDATVSWTDPAGRLRVTLPTDFLQLHEHGQPPLRPSRSVELGPPRRLAPDPVSPAPVDSPGVLWSAWEDELVHELSRVERHGGRHHSPAARDEDAPCQPRSAADLSHRRDAFASSILIVDDEDPRHARPAGPSRSRMHRRARSRWDRRAMSSEGDDPPF